MNTLHHPMIGDGYYPISDDALAAELEGAEVVEQNDMFGSFSVIVGYRAAVFSADKKSAQPFVCIRNHTPGLPHLFMCKEY